MEKYEEPIDDKMEKNEEPIDDKMEKNEEPMDGKKDGKKMSGDFLFGAVSGALVTLIILLILSLSGLVSYSANNNGAALPTLGNGHEGEQAKLKVAKVTKDDWVFGDRKAKISIVEYSDIDCPFCSRIHPTLKELVNKYPGKVNWVYRHFPLAEIHPEAVGKAMATECVGEKYGNDTFWKYLDALFAGSNPNEVISEAEKLGLDTDYIKSCLADRTYENSVSDDFQSGTAAGTNGTPNSIIVSGDENISLSGAQPFSQFDAIISNLLNK